MMLTYFLIYFFATFVIPTYRTYKKTGISPITFGKNDNAHDLIGLYMKCVMIMIFLSAIEADKFINFNFEIFFSKNAITQIGVALMLISLIWIMIAQVQMDNSWRIGIDEKNKTELKRVGLFKISRNPIFTGMIISQFGFYLFHSTFFNLLILIVTYLLISIQIRLEEEFLLKQHQSDYLEYKKNVPRWLFC